MRKLVILFAAAILFALPTVALANVVTFQAPATGSNQGSGGPNQFNLDHHEAYTWRIGGVNLTGQTITGATLTFHNIGNWDRNPNMLFIHLLDTARNASVGSFQDAPANQVPVTDIADDFAGSRYLNNPLVAPGTANTFLTQQSFTTTATDFVYTFTADQLQILSAYFMNGGDIAFGFATASPLALRQLRLLHPSRLRWRCSVPGWPGSTIVVEDNSKRNRSFSSTMDRSVQ